MSIPLTPVSSGPNLVTSARAQQDATLAALAVSNAPLFSSLLSASTAAIQQYTNRQLVQGDYVKYLDGQGVLQLMQLPEYPVNSISRIACSPQCVMTAQNTDAQTNQRATIATTGSSLVLLRLASGVATTNTLSFATYPTISALAAAVAGAGGGWTAEPSDGYELFASADLVPKQGAVNARGTPATLEMCVEDIEPYGFSMVDPYFGTTFGWRLDGEAGELYGIFPQGVRNCRIDFNAGYADVPDDLQQAAVIVALDMYRDASINHGLKSENLGVIGYTVNDRPFAISAQARSILANYVSYSSVY